MKVEMYKCDNCGKLVENRYSEEGWIHIEKPSHISIMKGIFDTCWRSAYRSFNKNLDFCDIECLIEYLNKLKEKGE